VKDEKEDVLDREKYDGGKTKTRAKDVFTKDTPQASPQKHPPGTNAVVLSAAAVRYLQQAHTIRMLQG